MSGIGRPMPAAGANTESAQTPLHNPANDGRPDHPLRPAERPDAGLQRDGPGVRAQRLQPGDRRGARPLRRHLPPRDRRAHRPGRARPAGLRRHDAVHGAGGDRAREPAEDPARRGRRLHRQRSLPRRHPPHGREVRAAVLPRRPALVLARQHRPLARHRRHGARRLFGQRHRGRAGGPAPAAGQALQAGRARRRDPVDHPLEHPHRRPAHRRHQGPGGGARHRPGAARRAARPLRRRDRRRRDRRAQAPGGAADAREDRDHPRRQLRRRGLRRFRRRRRRAAEDRDAHHQDRRQRRRTRGAVVRHERLVAAVQGADEQRDRDHALVDLPRGQARLSGGGDQRRHLRATAHRRPRRHLPLRPLSAAGLGLRRRGEPAHRRGGVRGARQGDSRASCSARPRAPAATSASAASIRRRTAPT